MIIIIYLMIGIFEKKYNQNLKKEVYKANEKKEKKKSINLDNNNMNNQDNIFYNNSILNEQNFQINNSNTIFYNYNQQNNYNPQNNFNYNNYYNQQLNNIPQELENNINIEEEKKITKKKS